MEGKSMTRSQITRAVIARLAGFILVMGLILFGTAGSFAYWQAWIYIALLSILVLWTGIYLIRNDPALLERRMRMKEKQAVQKNVVLLSFIYIGLLFVLPGLNFRFGWSVTPVWAVAAGDVVIVVGYLLLHRVLKENTFASRVIEVEQGQKVIDSGPYARIRHPMYTSVITVYLATPVALGFWWMILPGLVIIPMLAVRIRNEEEVLSRDLPGYEAYLQKVKYRLMPGVW
jgi:protein-S-isoprenylcysteine O-methyltransferase Ste14